MAEAAFQDRLWSPHLRPLGELADIRVVHCQVAAEMAWERIQRRQRESPTRGAHADAYLEQHTHTAGHDSFDRVRLDVPEFEVDTSDGYRPGLDEIFAFVNTGR